MARRPGQACDGSESQAAIRFRYLTRTSLMEIGGPRRATFSSRSLTDVCIAPLAEEPKPPPVGRGRARKARRLARAGRPQRCRIHRSEGGCASGVCSPLGLTRFDGHPPSGAQPEVDDKKRIRAGDRVKQLAPKGWELAQPVLSLLINTGVRSALRLPPT